MTVHYMPDKKGALCRGRGGYRTSDPWVITCAKCIKLIRKPLGVR